MHLDRKTINENEIKWFIENSMILQNGEKCQNREINNAIMFITYNKNDILFIP